MSPRPTTSEAELQAPPGSAELVRQLLESAPDAIVGIRRDGRIALVSAQTLRLFGYGREELLGRPAPLTTQLVRIATAGDGVDDAARP